MIILSEKERQLLDKLAAEGRAMMLYTEDLKVAMGRREETRPKRDKPPSQLTD
jgi:hypothetical protein